MLYAPISRKGGALRARSRYLDTRVAGSDTDVFVLAYGVIATHRLSLALAAIAQSFDDNWKLVFHGFGQAAVIDQIRAIDHEGRVHLSLDMVRASEETTVVSSAHIGLVIYGDTTANDRLTAFSSEKIALYFQCGLPVIAFGYPGYEHIAAGRCGVLLQTLDELPTAIRTILGDYEGYRERAYQCFLEHYDFEKNYRKVATALQALTGTSPRS
jgi:glycosyltransferase involved in cell wall biosynthesis